MNGLRIIFMGTPEFAVPSLGTLLMNNYNVVAAVSSPDKKAGRGLKTKKPAVAEYALDNYIDLLQPEDLNDPEFVDRIKKLKPDIIVVVAFRKLPVAVWKIPVLGTFNLHASLLPQYRGAAPINHVIINGEKETGITTFLIDDKIDTGKILFRKKVSISSNDTAGNLHDKLMREGAKLVVRTVKALERGKTGSIDQSELISKNEPIKTAPKIFTKDCYIDWSQDDSTVYNFIRGLYPSPGARTIMRKSGRDYIVKIGKCRCMKRNNALGPAETDSDGKSYLRIGTGGSAIDIERIQLEGRKQMDIKDFLRGFDTGSVQIITNPPV